MPRILAGLFLSVLVVALPGCKNANPLTEEGTPPPAVDPFVMNERLGRGVNFGNALEAPREGDWGVTLSAIQFQRAKEAGFDTIRLPIRWSSHALLSAPYTITSSFFERVDWAIDQAQAQGLNIILNVHHYEEMATDPEAHRDRWLAFWEQIATRYQYEPENVLFELLNEPNLALTAEIWNSMLDVAITQVRQTNPTRNLIVGPVFWNNASFLPTMTLPADSNLIVTVHFYEPFPFTHQGAEWVDGADAWLGTSWTGTPQQQAAVTNILAGAADWGEENNRPIFVGEFGAYSRADIDSRVAWTRFISREIERLGMSWSYWEFMAGFGIYNPSTGAWNEVLRDALLPPAG